MRVERFSLGLASPLDTARGRIEAREGALVRVSVGGRRGVGETTPLAGWTEPLEDALAALERADDDTPLGELPPAARHGLATARLDAAARAAEEPLAARLSAAPARRVPVNATVGDGPPADSVAEARAAVAAGFDCLKLKVGARGVEADLRRVRAVSDAVPGASLRLDANGAWDEAAARAVVEAVGDRIDYVEQPLPATELSGHRRLRETGVDVALDESLAEAGVDRLLEADAADVLVLKPMALGGPDRTVETARRAREAGVESVVTTTVDAVVGRTATLHAAAALPDVRACGLATGSMLARDLYPDPAPVVDGAATVPDGPGLAGSAFD